MKKGVKLTALALAAISVFFFLLPMEVKAEPNVLLQSANQSRKVIGQVLDELGEPMIGATVSVLGTNTATVTDINGDFTLPVKSSIATVEIRYIGYKIATAKATAGKKVQIKMELDAAGLDEVVVIGYGTVKRRDLTGAISSVKAADVKEAPTINAMEGLQGKISGLDITRESGQAGSTPKILLRGNRSLTADCSPLYVIDGISGGNINDLNPNDIESIEVLKDASSTAIYGSAGANGVIIVTTKKGIQGKTQVDFDAYYGVNAFPSYPSMLQGKEWLNFLNEGYAARYGEYLDVNNEEQLMLLFNEAGLSTGAIEAYKQGKWVDWKDELLQTGTQQNYNISIRGGGEKQQSYMSAGYRQEKGLYRNDQVDNLTFRAGTTYIINKAVSAGFQSALSYRNQERRDSRLSKSLSQLPLGDPYTEDGEINRNPISDMSNYINILVDDDTNAYRHNTKSMAINVAPFIEIKPLKGLSLRSMFNASLGTSRDGLFDGLNTYMKLTGSAENKRIATYRTGHSYSYMWQNVLNYNFNIKNHEFTVTGITEYSNGMSESSVSQNEQFDYDDFLWYKTDAGQKAYAASSYTGKSKMSYAGRLSYNYLGRYILSASIRWDGASQLYNKWNSFPAVSAAWRISDEPFMKSVNEWLDNLKLRIGYGVSGNANIDAYVTETMVTSSANYLNLGTGLTQGYILAQNVANYDLTWEKSYNWNLGIDFSVLDRRIDGSIEFYTTDTKGVLYDRNLPSAFGGYHAKAYYQKMANIGKISNKGVEITINTRNIDNKNFKWNSTITWAKNKEELKGIDLGNNITADKLVSLNLFYGEPVNTFYGYKKTGIWQLGQEAQAACFDQEPGGVRLDVPGLVWDPDYSYVTTSEVTAEDGTVTTVETQHQGGYYKPSETTTDVNGNEIRKYYDANSPYVVGPADRQILGSRTPDWTFGFHNTFQIYDFDISIMSTMRWGQMINGELLSYLGSTTQVDCYDYWTPDNPTNAYPRPNFGGGVTDYQKEALRYVDGSFFKIKNITVGYTVPKNLIEKIGMTKLRLYTTVHNPFIWSKHDQLKGMDPENSASDKFPLYRTIVVGLNASF
ncbi:MAG: TonB-dependent receptor [Prevotella sp.]|nr:TonB-dependent receptor [Prevotella sp.]